MFKRILASLLIVFGAILMATAPAQANGSNNSHKVWVCKYVGQPGDYETLKAGKQPIQVDVSAADDYVGADFADGQYHSVVIDLVTPENTDRHNDYIGEATCPTPPTPTTTSTAVVTTTTVPESTTTVPESTTSTTSAPTTTTTQPPGTTTTVPETTTSVVVPTSTTQPAPSTTTTTRSTVTTSTVAPPTEPTTIAPPPPVKPGPSTPPPAVLAFTGGDSGNWLALGICLFFLGVTLLACSKVRKTHPWDA